MGRYRISCTHLLMSAISYFLYLSRKRRDIYIVNCFLDLRSYIAKSTASFIKTTYLNAGLSACKVCCFCHILTKIVPYWHVVVKPRNMKYHDNPSGPWRVVPCGQMKGRTYGYDEASIRYCFAKLTCSMFRVLIKCIYYFKKTNKCISIYNCNFIS